MTAFQIIWQSSSPLYPPSVYDDVEGDWLFMVSISLFTSIIARKTQDLALLESSVLHLVSGCVPNQDKTML